MTSRQHVAALVVALSVWAGIGVLARDAPPQMDLRQAAGVPLPVADVPAGTVSVRVIRGSFANNLPNVAVQLLVNGTPRTATTDASGRAQFSGLAAGARVKATAAVDGEKLESQEFTIAASGIRVMLLATDKTAS